MTCLSSSTSCKLLILSSQYTLSLMRFLSLNLEIYTFISTIHGFNTRNKLQLHKPSTTRAIYQKGTYYNSMKIINVLPRCIAEFVLRKNVLYQI